jgi:hypothetical protein
MRLQRWSLLCLSALAAGFSVAADAQAPAAPPPGRVIGRSGADLVAYAAPPACAPRVVVTIVGSNPQMFSGGVSPAARFFGGVRAGHSLACPQMTRMLAKGLHNGSIMFSAMSDRNNDWEAVILGNSLIDSATENRLGTRTGPSDQVLLLRTPSFLDAQKVVAQAQSTPFLCVNRSAAGCEVISRIESRGSSVLVTNRYRAGGGGALAVVATPSQVAGGLLCGDTRSANVTIEGGNLVADARADLAEQIRERILQNERVCTGFQGQPNGTMTMHAFDGGGRRLRTPNPAQFSASALPLAVPQ